MPLPATIMAADAAVAPVPVAAEMPRRGWRAWIDLTKLRLNTLVLFSVAGAFVLASPQGVIPWHLVLTAVGAALVAMGSSALNMVMERGPDALMERTRNRPIPAGVISVRAATAFGATLVVAGVACLAVLDARAPVIACVIAALYLAVYTPLKRVSTLNTIVGAVPGALPPVLGWAAAGGDLDLRAWSLFGIVFCWQVPHFLAIAATYRDDYARGGFRMLPVVDAGGSVMASQVVVWTLALIPVSLLPRATHLTGDWSVIVALVLGAAFFAFSVRFAWTRTLASARLLFWASIIYLPVLWTALVLDRA